MRDKDLEGEAVTRTRLGMMGRCGMFVGLRRCNEG